MLARSVSKWVETPFWSFFTDNKADVFKCSWGNIPIFLQCDGTNNCGDNSDEEDCNKGNIKSNK